jgi:iron transport multicopper oxidase
VIDAHDETTVEIDSIYTKPVDVNAGGTLTHMTPGQRQAVLIHTKKEADRNYAIWAEMDYNILFFKKGILPPTGYNANVTAWLVYNDSAPLPDPFVLHILDDSAFFDDTNYEPLDEMPLLGPVDHQIVWTLVRQTCLAYLGSRSIIRYFEAEASCSGSAVGINR